MTQQNNFVRFFILLFLSINMVTITSCNKEGCTNEKAENYDAKANKDDGNCRFTIDKFLGTYAVTESCNSGNYEYTITVTKDSDEDKIVINNFGGYGIGITALFNESDISISDSQEGIEFSGTGHVDGSFLTINYTATQDASVDSCAMNCVKQ